MRKFLDQLYKNQSLIYKYILYAVSVFLVVFFFPKGGKFKYEFQKGKPWQYDNLYAPFDFSIKKTAEEIANEKLDIQNNLIDYYAFDEDLEKEVYYAFERKFDTIFAGYKLKMGQFTSLKKVGYEILDEIFANGVITSTGISTKKSLYLVKGNEARRVGIDDFYRLQDISGLVDRDLSKRGLSNYTSEYQELFFNIIKPNVFYDENLSQKELDNEFSELSTTRGNIDEGKLIIVKGEVVEADNFKILNSLKEEYESELWAANNYYFILFGYTVLVALVLLMLLLFLKKYRPITFKNNTKVTFIFFNILLMVF
ncbi:MAG: phosphohydrolase, partial [Flavobacteriales bacterium]